LVISYEWSHVGSGNISVAMLEGGVTAHQRRQEAITRQLSDTRDGVRETVRLTRLSNLLTKLGRLHVEVLCTRAQTVVLRRRPASPPELEG
jgi:hypothetical protein